MLTVHLIDTPSHTALTANANTLRAKLKDWEKSFAASHSGHKPGKEDIRACLEIAKTYKDYNRVRDVLAGKPGVEYLDEAARRSPTATKVVRRRNDERGHVSSTEARRETLHKSAYRTAKVSPCQRRSPPHPNLLDPYDPPASASPRRYLITAIGPTPQRDGKVLGLFDLLSNSGNSSQAISSTRKRKVDSLADVVQPDSGRCNEGMFAQTPSRKRSRNGNAGCDILDHLDGNSPKGNQRHSRTPASEGKKFMLSQFFATPSTARFGAFAEDQDGYQHGQAVDQGASASRTPLRTHVLGDQAKDAAEAELPGLDATPAYLKRSYSFKDRLLSASASATATADSRKKNLQSPTSIRAGPPTLRRYKSGPKPLSEIVRGLRRMDDERHDDDLNALREMESGQINVLIRDSQAADFGAGTTEEGMEQEVAAGVENEAPRKVWKKKGQKRTTRRTNMRPVIMKPKKENQWVAEASEGEDGDGSETVEEMQYATQLTTLALGDGEGNLLVNDLPASTGRGWESMDKAAGVDNHSRSESCAEFEDDSDRDELDHYEKPLELEVGLKRIRKVNFDAEATKSTKRKRKGRDKNSADKAKQKGPTINPNAVSHQNFRSLKIRNKNSKAKGGRGRFGRNGR